jgi:hypothetical protein
MRSPAFTTTELLQKFNAVTRLALQETTLYLLVFCLTAGPTETYLFAGSGFVGQCLIKIRGREDTVRLPRWLGALCDTYDEELQVWKIPQR